MRVRLFASLRDRIGKKELHIQEQEASTVKELLEHLSTQYPNIKELLYKDGELTSFYHVLINGKNIQQLDGLDTILKEVDTIAILPPVGGGIFQT